MTLDVGDRPPEADEDFAVPLTRDSDGRLRIGSAQAVETAALKAAVKTELKSLQQLAFKAGIYGERVRGLLHLFTRAFCEQEGDLSEELLHASIMVAETLRVLAANLSELEAEESTRISALAARVG